jgi:hypothetical protein
MRWTTLALLGAGCGLNMAQHYGRLRPDLVDGDFGRAAQRVIADKDRFYGDKNRLLYLMDLGVLQNLAGQYRDSNRALEEAKALAEALWTDSIALQGAAWISTDNALAYPGEDFEQVLLHFVAALNHMALGDLGAARVEARQITARLDLLGQHYRATYQDDGFARWLSGMLAESEGSYSGLNDAWIDYRRAIAVYETTYQPNYRTAVPRALVADALRALALLGDDFAADLDDLRGRYPAVAFTGDRTRVVVLLQLGEAPHKVDDFWTAPAGNRIVHIAFPKFVPRPARVASARLQIGDRTAEGEVAEDITAIAIQNLDDRMGRIRAKAIARVVAKLVASSALDAAGQKRQEPALQLAGLLLHAASVATEEADKRSWVTLPGRVEVLSLAAEPGQHRLRIQLFDAAGSHIGSRETDVQVQPGGIAFVSMRVF